MAEIKRLVLVILLIFAGILLTLAGTNLIQLTPDLLLYLGIGLIILATVYYFLLPPGKTQDKKKEGEGH